MSFKREGDDLSQLNLLKKRRVSDLLAEDIPEDEAFLMRSGRYACTVCHHRPVFDTIAMLQVHRNGKKHLGNVKHYYTKKQNLMKEIEKRKQLMYLADPQGSTSLNEKVFDEAPLLTNTKKATHHALLKAAPYKGNAGSSAGSDGKSSEQRKTCQNTKASFFQRLTNLPPHQKPNATQSSSLPGNRKFSSSGQANVTSLTSHDAEGTKANQLGSTEDKTASYRKTTRTSVDNAGQSFGGPLTVNEKRSQVPFQLQPYIPKHLRKSNLQDRNLGEPQSTPPSQTDSPSFTDNWSEIEDSLSSRHPTTHWTKICLQDCGETATNLSKESNSMPQANFKKTLPSKYPKEKSVNPSKESSHMPRSTEDDSQRLARDRYLQKTSSGWKPDWKGGWVQDQDVEFDSDEEAPAYK